MNSWLEHMGVPGQVALFFLAPNGHNETSCMLSGIFQTNTRQRSGTNRVGRDSSPHEQL